METTIDIALLTTGTESSFTLQEIISALDNSSLPSGNMDLSTKSVYTGHGDDDDDAAYDSNASLWFNSTDEVPTTHTYSYEIPPNLILKIILCTAVLLLTFFGNALVLYAYATTKKLRTYTNYYIVGLAVADLISGGIIPGVENLLWYLDTWPFSEGFCAATQYLIHVFIQATFMMTLVICFDRFRALIMPLKHLKEKTLKHACFMISFAYIIPILIWTPIIIIFPYTGFTTRIRPPLCHGSYAFHPPLLIFAVLILSWIPMIATIVLYAFVYSAVIRKGINKKRGIGEEVSSDYKSERQASKRVSEKKNESRAQSYSLEDDHCSEKTAAREHTEDGEQATGQVYSLSAGLSVGLTNMAYVPTEDELENNSVKPSEVSQPALKETAMSSQQLKRPGTLARSKRFKLEGRLASLRATRTLTYILITTVVSAAPWSVFGLWAAVYPYDFPISNNEFKFLGWLAHLSSTVNPFCYAVCNPIFKEAFLRILRCRKPVPLSRSSTVRSQAPTENSHVSK